MQETIEENIISWLAGFYDAEGCVRIDKSVRKKGYVTYRPVIILNNTNIETMDFCALFLKNRGINAYIRESHPTTSRKRIRYIEVSRITKIIELCDLLLPYSLNKHDELVLIKQFCKSRQDRFVKNEIANKKMPYNNFEVSLYEKLVRYKAHKKGNSCLSYEPIYSDTNNNITWSWLAGYTDGDGSFSVNEQGSPSYCIGTTNPTVSIKLAEFFHKHHLNFYFYSKLPSANHLKTCKLRMCSYFINDLTDILYIVRHLKPYLISKCDVGNTMLEYCELRSRRKGLWRTEHEKSFVESVCKLNLR